MADHFSKLRLSVFMVAMALLAGCASSPPPEPTLGDAMRQHSDEVRRQSDLKRQLAEDWERGNEQIQAGRKLVERGEKRIDKAEKELEKGSDEVERGTLQIAEGRELKSESERQFRARFPDLELNPDNVEP